MSIVIKMAYQPHEAKKLSKIASETFWLTWKDIDPQEAVKAYIEENFSEKAISKDLKDGSVLYFLAYFNESYGKNIVGYAKLNLDKAPQHKPTIVKNTMEIEKLYILPDYQNQKVGEGLMNEILLYAESDGFKNIWLGVFKENEKAMNFYKKFGFEVTSTYTFKLADVVINDDLCMEKTL
jgi:diamine N-acetyltransferase